MRTNQFTWAAQGLTAAVWATIGTAGVAQAVSLPAPQLPTPYALPGTPLTAVPPAAPSRSVGISLPGPVEYVQATPTSVIFNVNYTDGASEGFNDPGLGGARRGSFESALNVWSGYLTRSYTGETVTVNAAFNSLGGSSGGATLGSAGSTFIHRDFGTINANPKYQSATWYGSPLANHVRGGDLDAGNNEINAQFNTDVDNSTVLGSTDWYYGSDPSGLGGDIDFQTVALHEIGHGINFFDLINENDGTFQDGFAGVYDRFLTTGATGGTALTAMTNAERNAAIRSGNLYWSGANAIAGNGGVRPEIFAPNPYQGGSSVSHLDEGTYGDQLMSPLYSGLDRMPSALELGMLADMGWDIAAVPEPTAIALMLVGAAAVLRRRRAAA